MNVVGWRGRNVPGDRVIPPHLKLAILTRGRTLLPTENIDWLVDVARAVGQTWPNRLRRRLSEIVVHVQLTVELFSNQRPEMTQVEIGEVFQGYLTLRRQRHFPDRLLLWRWLPHVARTELENEFDLDISRLFEKARVTAQPGHPERFLLLAYASLPEARILEFIAPEKPGPPTSPAMPMPPLEGITSPSTSYKLRDAPGTSSKVLGQQVGAVVPVRVFDKSEADGSVWLEIELSADLDVVQDGTPARLTSGTRCWIVGQEKKPAKLLEKLLFNKGPSLEGGGLEYVAAPWDFFRFQLRSFESDNSMLGLDDRITKLRQMSHRKDVPFDYVIGARPGSVYLDSQQFERTGWQLLKDYQAVRAPDGRIVDLHHVLVGLDVLRRAEQKHVDFAGMDIGSNWGGATWGGDLGAGAADLDRRASGEWEDRHKGANFGTRAQYYFDSRAGDLDLVADVDVWGIHALRGEPDSIDALVAAYYEHTIVEGARTVTSPRRDAIERFLSHCGFEYDVTTGYARYPFLVTQRGPRERVRSEIARFARIWKFGHDPLGGGRVDGAAVEAMTLSFLYWLEYQTIENGATVQP